MRNLVAIACVLSGAVAWSIPREQAQSDIEPQAVRSPREAVDERCADCHPAIAAGFASTGMARAVGSIEAGELEGLEPVSDAAFTYSFRQRGEKAWITESWEGVDGAPDQQRMVRLAFAIGAGMLDRSYVASAGGRAWFAPLEVVSAHDDVPRHAALAPGHMTSSGQRFDTGITVECLACHTDALPPRDYPLNKIPRDFVPRGLSCAVCHPHGEQHSDWRERELSGEELEGADPMLSISRMGLNERISICARCHLQGDARIALDAGARGVPTAGQDFLAEWAVYVPEEVDSDVAFVGHVERMMLSPCFKASRGTDRELSCETCHDPHVSVFDEAGRAHVRGACNDCHSQAPAAGDPPACTLPIPDREGEDCVACHMRRTQVFDVAGVRIFDHYIRRRPGGSSHFEKIREKHSRDGRLKLFTWPGTELPEIEGDRGLKMMAAIIAKFPQVAAEHVDAQPGAVSRTLPRYHHLRGTLLEEMGRFEDAASAYERAIELDAEAVESRVNLALTLMRLSRAGEALALCDEVLAKYPRAYGALRNRALVKLNMGDAEGFAADLEAAQRLYPRSLNARALAEHFRRRGDALRAGHWEAEAARLGP